MSRILAGLALVLGLFAPAAAWAQSGAADIFTVARVSVEATAASAEAARLIAQDRGRAQALQILLQRLTPSGDWPYLPHPQLSDLLDMQVGFEVEHERFSTLAGAQNRYLADITYSFRRDRIRSLLRREGTAFSESQASPALVLAVFEREDERLLWEEENPWAAAWYEMDFSHELVPMMLPLGDLSDTTIVSVDDVVSGNWAALEFLATRYNVNRIFVAHAVLLDDGFGNARLYARVTELSADGVGQIIDTQVGGALAAGEVSSLGDIGTRAITLLSGQLQERWKSQTLVSYDVIHRIDATAVYNSLDEWVAIREALEGSATVNEYNAYALSARGAELSVTFVGSVQQLMITLEQHGVALTGTRGYWDLRLRGADGNVSPATGAPAQGAGQAQNLDQIQDQAYGYNPFREQALPPVETLVVEEREPRRAPALSSDELEGIFDPAMTPEEIDAQRREQLRQQFESGPGTMAPIGD